MNDDFVELQIHMLALILRAQVEILNRLNGTPMLVARPPMRVARPPDETNQPTTPLCNVKS